MVPELIARVDGLPVVLLDREQVWPKPTGTGTRTRRSPSASRRARIERQTAVVHECRLPRWAGSLIAEQAAEQERLELRAEMAASGLL